MWPLQLVAWYPQLETWPNGCASSWQEGAHRQVKPEDILAETHKAQMQAPPDDVIKKPNFPVADYYASLNMGWVADVDRGIVNLLPALDNHELSASREQCFPSRLSTGMAFWKCHDLQKPSVALPWPRFSPLHPDKWSSSFKYWLRLGPYTSLSDRLLSSAIALAGHRLHLWLPIFLHGPRTSNHTSFGQWCHSKFLGIHWNIHSPWDRWHNSNS